MRNTESKPVRKSGAPKLHLTGWMPDGRRINRKYKRWEPCHAMMQRMSWVDVALLHTVKAEDIGNTYEDRP